MLGIEYEHEDDEDDSGVVCRVSFSLAPWWGFVSNGANAGKGGGQYMDYDKHSEVAET